MQFATQPPVAERTKLELAHSAAERGWQGPQSVVRKGSAACTEKEASGAARVAANALPLLTPVLRRAARLASPPLAPGQPKLTASGGSGRVEHESARATSDARAIREHEGWVGALCGAYCCPGGGGAAVSRWCVVCAATPLLLTGLTASLLLRPITNSSSNPLRRPRPRTSKALRAPACGHALHLVLSVGSSTKAPVQLATQVPPEVRVSPGSAHSGHCESRRVRGGGHALAQVCPHDGPPLCGAAHQGQPERPFAYCCCCLAASQVPLHSTRYTCGELRMHSPLCCRAGTHCTFS